MTSVDVSKFITDTDERAMFHLDSSIPSLNFILAREMFFTNGWGRDYRGDRDSEEWSACLWDRMIDERVRKGSEIRKSVDQRYVGEMFSQLGQ